MAIETTQADETTATLISRAADGEEAAFAQIVAAHHDDMTRVCFVIAGDLDIADEAVQAAWAIVWRKLPTLRQADRLRPWLVSVAANETRQLLRRHRRRSDRAAAEDIVADSLLAALDHGRSLRDGDALRPWLLRIATNRALRHRRRGARIVELDIVEGAPAESTRSSSRSTGPRRRSSRTPGGRRGRATVGPSPSSTRRARVVAAKAIRSRRPRSTSPASTAPIATRSPLRPGTWMGSGSSGPPREHRREVVGNVALTPAGQDGNLGRVRSPHGPPRWNDSGLPGDMSIEAAAPSPLGIRGMEGSICGDRRGPRPGGGATDGSGS